MKLGTFKIGTRLGMGLGLIMMLMIALILLGLSSMRSINEEMDAIIRQNNKQIWFANIIKDSIHSIDEAMLTLIQTKQDRWNNFEHVKILTAKGTYRDALEKLEELERSGKGKELIERFKTSAKEARWHLNKVTDLKRAGRDHDAALAYFAASNRTIVASLHQICSELVAYEEGQSNKRYAEAVKTYVAARRMFIIIAAVMVLFAITAAVILTRSITRPIRKGVDIANRLAEGDLDVVIEVRNQDETGQLLAAMKNMVERLKQTKELEHQLQQSQKLETVGRLAGGIAHDFNNMLTVILGNMELIKMQHRTDKKTVDRCAAIETAVSRASGFIKQLLALSRKQVLELKPVDVGRLVSDFEKMIRRVIGENIEMSIQCPQHLPTIKADAAQINQVLLNLVVNAREAMPHGGELVIGLDLATLDEDYCWSHPDAKPGEYVVLTVGDTGVGMSRAIARSIFEPFFTTKETGTGLGLSVVYGIVKQHGGFLTMQSEVGKGTVFEVYLPSTLAVAAESAGAPPEFSIVRGEGTVLMVEDDEELRRTTSDLLEILGYRVRAAADGFEGVAIFRECHHDIDLVLLDVVMPKMSGYEAYAEMRKIDPSIPSLFVTGYSVMDAHLRLGLDNGTDAIQKPYSAEALSEKIRKILESKSSRAA